MISVGCIDTPGWSNGAKQCFENGGNSIEDCIETGWTCKGYEKLWCWGGGPKANKSFALGLAFNFPEKHCCACGKSLGSII